MKSTFKIKGLDCANCAQKLENSIAKIDEVEKVSINFMMQKMIIEYNEENKKIMLEKIKKVIKKEDPDVKMEEI